MVKVIMDLQDIEVLKEEEVHKEAMVFKDLKVVQLEQQDLRD